MTKGTEIMSIVQQYWDVPLGLNCQTWGSTEPRA